MLESMKDLGRDREYDRLMKYFVVESETCVGVRDVSYGMYLQENKFAIVVACACMPAKCHICRLGGSLGGYTYACMHLQKMKYVTLAGQVAAHACITIGTMTKCEGTRRVVPKVGASQQKWMILTGWKESVVYTVRSDTIAKIVRIGRQARPHKYCNT